jgi:hypothetical protein
MRSIRIGLAVALIAGLFNFIGADVPAQAATGDTDTALSFNGTSQYVYANSATQYILSDSFTVEAWLKPDSTCNASLECMIVNKEGNWEFAIRSGTLQYALFGTSNWNWQTTGVSIPTDQWSHVSFTRLSKTAAIKSM